MHFRALFLAGLTTALFLPQRAPANDIILQYYESQWETIEKKMPDVFVSGYNAFWLPPPYKADTGGFSVGYDVYDRFNLGTSFDRTLYGTYDGTKQLVGVSQRAGMQVYFDWVPNHNGFRDNSTPGFHAAGGYPGFVLTLPGDVDGDFHSAFASGELDYRLAGLIDIAQEKNHVFYRNPVFPDPQNIPNQQPRLENRRLYPDQSLPPNFLGIHPYNLQNPDAGDPTQENATGLLLRHAQWMIEVVGADGFRIDAVKHVPTWFFNSFYDNVVFQRGRPTLAGNPTTPFSFGEAFTSDFGTLAAYTRKDGFGNRDVLDFPLYFTLKSVFSAGGFGNMADLEFASFDGQDGNANDGSRGIPFVGSHDEGPPTNSNVAYAFILTRPGYPVVYFNAKEFGDNRSFPQDGRGDALGGDFGSILPTLVDVSRRYAKGTFFKRHLDGDTYVYERFNSLLVGLNDREDSGYDTRTVFTGFPVGTELTELTGAVTDPIVNANADLYQNVTVDGSGQVTIRVPRNRTNSNLHRRGYVMYGLPTAQQSLTFSPVTQTLTAETTAVPNGIRRHTPIEVVTSDTMTIEVQTSGATLEDNALVKLDRGVDINQNPGLFITSGEFAGYEDFNSASPRASAGSGLYSLTTSTTGLAEGLHFVQSVAFTPRPGGSPAAYSTVRKVFYLDRVPPPVNLVFPSTTGTSDVVSQSYTVVASCPDFTADSMHVFFDELPAYDFLGNVSPSNAMQRTNRGEFRFTWNGITAGDHTITIVAFEPTGNSSVTHFNPVNVVIPQPNMALGVDTNPSNTAVNFQPFPATISTAVYGNEIVVRVDHNSGALSFPADFTVSLEVDGVVYNAQAYSPALLPPVNRLVQNDQDLGDGFDEFRFLWRGYSTGNHQFIARAQLTAGGSPPNSVEALVNVPSGTAGPTLNIIAPTGAPNFNAPSNLSTTLNVGSAAASVLVYLQQGPLQTLFGSQNDPPTSLTLNRAVSNAGASDDLANLNIENGIYTLRAVASTGPGGTGIATEATTTFSVSGFPGALPNPAPVIDGDISEFFDRLPLAVSAANGGAGGGDPADFGADGSLMELHGRVFDNTLFLAVRGDMFNGVNPNSNFTVLLIDTDFTSGTGAKSIHGPGSDLNDLSNTLRNKVSRVGAVLDSALVSAGAGFDAAVIIDGTDPLTYEIFGFGSGGVEGSPTDFAILNGTLAFATGMGIFPGAPGTTVSGPTGFEVAIPLVQLGNVNPREMRFAVVTCSDDLNTPSPNTLPENAQNNYTGPQVLDGLAKFPDAPGVLLNEAFNGTPDWVEVHNTTGGAIDLSEYYLRWGDGSGISGLLPLTGLSVPAGGYAVAADGPLAPTPANFLQFASNIPWAPSRAGSASLLDPYGIAIDYVRWLSLGSQTFSDSAPPGTAFSDWSTGFDGEAGSPRALARDENSTDTDLDPDWSSNTPTPGAQNPPPLGVARWPLY